jgi:hypothetical protein
MRKAFLRGLILACIIVSLPSISRAGCSSTGSKGLQAENSDQVTTSGPRTLTLAAAENFDTSNAKVLMLFDATSLPTNGAIPVLAVPIAAATSATQPSPGSFSLPTQGFQFQNGIVFALSTTAKTLTVDTTAGGNAFFQWCWQ